MPFEDLAGVDEARAELRAIDKGIALQILKGVHRLVAAGSGDVVQLHGFRPPRFRLRVGDWRVVFRSLGGGAIQVISVGHRSKVYR